jgi:MSHA pilin protein MshC
MVELIMVLILIGILAVFTLPRLNPGDFEARGFHDETLALLRYAQKTAIAQRRAVCVAFTASTATLSITPAAGPVSCSQPLPVPNNSGLDHITAAAGVGYQAVPANPFFFNALGAPSEALALQVTQAGSPIPLNITVQAETGYVHD